jgi:hypothetical protein
VKEISKNSATPLKDQTYESWALKKEKEVQAKGIGIVSNKIIGENFPNLKRSPFRYRTPNRHDQHRTTMEYYS